MNKLTKCIRHFNTGVTITEILRGELIDSQLKQQSQRNASSSVLAKSSPSPCTSEGVTGEFSFEFSVLYSQCYQFL